MPDAKSPADDDDDDELELEPVDPEILARERQRGTQRTEAAVSKVDVDELYGDTGPYSDLPLDLSQLKQFRFTTRHLLVATALLAILLTLFRLFPATKAIVVIAAVLLAAGWFFTLRLERKQEAERERRRAEFFGEPVEGEAPIEEGLVEAPPRPEFRFAFSIKELLITTAVAAVALALLRIVGRDALSMGLGLIALAGIAANAMGYDPPRHIVLGWWLLLVMYLLVGLLAIVSPEETAGRSRRCSTPPVMTAELERTRHGATA